jgi:hypothetical protein
VDAVAVAGPDTDAGSSHDHPLQHDPTGKGSRPLRQIRPDRRHQRLEDAGAGVDAVAVAGPDTDAGAGAGDDDVSSALYLAAPAETTYDIQHSSTSTLEAD